MSIYNTIINPETNRPVFINGKTGKRVLTQYLIQLQHGGDDEGTGKCKKGKCLFSKKALILIEKMNSQLGKTPCDQESDDSTDIDKCS